MPTRSTNVALAIMLITIISLTVFDLSPSLVTIQAAPDHPTTISGAAGVSTSKPTTTMRFRTTQTTSTTISSSPESTSTNPTTSTPVNFSENFTITSISINTTSSTTSATTTISNVTTTVPQQTGAEWVVSVLSAIYDFIKAVLTNF